MVKVEFMMKLATRGQYKYFDLTFQVVCGLRGSSIDASDFDCTSDSN